MSNTTHAVLPLAHLTPLWRTRPPTGSLPIASSIGGLTGVLRAPLRLPPRFAHFRIRRADVERVTRLLQIVHQYQFPGVRKVVREGEISNITHARPRRPTHPALLLRLTQLFLRIRNFRVERRIRFAR